MEQAERLDQSIRSGINAVSTKVIPIVSKLMGMMLILYGIMYLYSKSIVSDTNTAAWTVYVGLTVIFVCGTLILVDFSFNLNRTIGLYAIGIGGNRVMKFINYIFVTGDEIISLVMFSLGMVMVVTSLNLCYTGTVFIRNLTRSRVSMIITSFLMLVLNLAMLLMMKEMTEESIWDVIESSPDIAAMTVLYLILICMLGTYQVRMTALDEHYTSILNGIRRTSATSIGSYVYRPVAATLSKAFTDRSHWVKVDDGGPVEQEFRFVLHQLGSDRSFVRVQKWKGRDELFFTISDHQHGSLINAYRFSVKEIITEGDLDTCGYIHLYGNDTHIQIVVRDAEKKKKWGVTLGI